MKALIAVAALALTGASQQQPLPDQPAPRLATIDMAITSWGKPVSTWSIDAHGTLTYTTPEPNWHSAERSVTWRYQAGMAGFRRMRVLIGQAETRATPNGRELTCTVVMTDQHYGSVTWTQPNGRKTVLRFYTACREYATRSIVKQLQLADAQAAAWARAGTIIETTKVERQ